MGYDRHLSYQKIIAISIYVQRGLVFIGTNPDKNTMIEGLKIPGNGSFISVIEQATGVSAEIAGKPNIFILDSLIQRDKLERKECLMIGDNLLTDIEFGMRAKIDTVCVLTGVSNEQMVLASNLPTYFCDFLAWLDGFVSEWLHFIIINRSTTITNHEGFDVSMHPAVALHQHFQLESEDKYQMGFVWPVEMVWLPAQLRRTMLRREGRCLQLVPQKMLPARQMYLKIQYPDLYSSYQVFL